ncbi:MAG: hydroxymethylbilane synthase [Candidatus Omnitrophica bacterium]|nr:hydroxymethylbilane synthase [Candidatus Omnitrophota bacterium]
MKRVRIGTRGSALAQAQANEVKEALEKAHPDLRCELTVIRTTGDDFPPAAASGTGAIKGLFVKEIEEALLGGEVELAVHSVKDLQAELPAGLRIGAILKRQDPRDALVTKGEGKRLTDLPPQARVGVSSLRRQSQLARLRRDLIFSPIRGNVDTRLRKLDGEEYAALVLAACGLIRLGLKERISETFEPARMVPAPGQGALGVEIREDNAELAGWLAAVNDPDSQAEIEAERAFLKALGGGCSVPVGALARVHGESLTLTGAVLSPDGLKAIRKETTGPRRSAERIGTELASHLRADGADRLLYGQWKRPMAGERANE